MLDVDRFERMLSEGLIARGAWSSETSDGRTMLCALSALSEDVERACSVSACPADDCPPWLAAVIPWLCDDVSAEAWPEAMRRLGVVAVRLKGISPSTLRRADYECRAEVLEIARRHLGKYLSHLSAGERHLQTGVEEIVSRALALCRRASRRAVRADEWEAEVARAREQLERRVVGLFYVRAALAACASTWTAVAETIGNVEIAASTSMDVYAVSDEIARRVLEVLETITAGGAS